RAKALARGRDLLAELEDIRHGLLIGALSTQRLQGLLGMVHSRRGPDDDPRIRAVLNEIELRARVELAKLGLPA
ncbi:MAG: flagellar assembly protein FliX, partial [Alphaproteobacteria bacterium]|nr:flagellar assembly protein FliX [Alphaproteobacteria bacterium]